MGGATNFTRGTVYSCIHVCVQVCALLQRCNKQRRQRGRSSCCGAPPSHPAGVAGGAPNRRGAHEVAVVRRAQQRHGVRGHWVGALQRRVPDAQQLALASCEAREDGHQRSRRAALEEVKPGDRGTAHIPASGKSAGSSCTCTPAARAAAAPASADGWCTTVPAVVAEQSSPRRARRFKRNYWGSLAHPLMPR